MAWEARSGLRPILDKSMRSCYEWLNVLGSPFGIETIPTKPEQVVPVHRLNGLGSPFGIETDDWYSCVPAHSHWLNGLGSPFGIETIIPEKLKGALTCGLNG